MQIIVTPNDIIQRCLWDKYAKFCLKGKNKEEISNILANNKPISLSENDAYVIGLLKVIETENLVHRFNEEIIESLQIKSNVIDDQLYIKKSMILKQIDEYMNKFPVSYTPPVNYIDALKDLTKYVGDIRETVSVLKITSIKKHDILINYYNSKEVKRTLSL